jgi:PAS domain S-box-containing protein
MSLYGFVNSLLAGLFAFAALHFFLLWRQSRGERLLFAVGIHCTICAIASACLVFLARAETIPSCQRLLDARFTLALLGQISGVWVLSLVTGVKARRFIALITTASLSLTLVNVLILPINGTVTGIDQVRLIWGEEVHIPQHRAVALWMCPAYTVVLFVQLFGLAAGTKLLMFNRLGGMLVILASGGTIVVVVGGVFIDFFRVPLPYFGTTPVAALMILIALLVSRGYHQLNEKLTELEGDLQAIFDHSIGFIGLIDVNGTLLRINRAALKFAGISEEHAVGKPFWETPWWIHSPELQLRLREAIQAAASGSLMHFEASHHQLDGRLSHVDYSLKPVRNEKNEISLLIVEGRDITARKETEEKLYESNQLNKQIIASAPDGLIVMDRDLRYQVWNPRMEEISGLPASDVLGKKPIELFPFLESTDVYKQIERALAGEIVRSEDFPFNVPDTGHKGWSTQMVGPLRNAHNEIIGVLVSVIDISNRKAIEEKLLAAGRRAEEAHALLDTLQTVAPIGLGFVDVNFRFVLCNSALADINGVAPSEHIGRLVCEIIPGLWPQIQPLYDMVRSGSGPILNREVIGETPAQPGVTRSWQVSYYPVQIREEIIGIGIIVSETTDRKSAEATIEQERLRLAGIIDSAMDGIITIDESQRIVLFNTAAENIFRYRADEMIGRSIETLLPERVRSIHADYVRQFGRSNVSHNEMGKGRPISGLRADGEEFPLEASISQITLNGQKFFTVTCRDMTERVRAQETRQKLEAQLLQSQKMEAIGLLAGGVAHDFNNLLTVISGYSEVLLNALGAHESLFEPARAIMEASTRAASLTRQLLVFSRQRVAETKVLDLNAVVSEAEKMLRRVIGEDIRFTVSLDPTIGSVRGEPAQLNQVLMNLVVNARDAMPKGGSLTIETLSIGGDGGLQTSPGSQEKFAQLKVADTGIGMTPEVAARIFEPFFTTKGLGKGTGLGLAVVHGIVEQSHGRIEVESKPGVGTTFLIHLPVLGESLPAVEQRDIVSPPLGTETILLVEDDDSVRKLAVISLLSQGYRVVPAIDGQDALRIVEEHPDQIDLLLTDVVMPNIDGLDLAKILRAKLPSLKILFMSGYSGEAITQRNLTHEDMFLLQKPYTPTSLVRKVREVLDAG